ncbi:high mobility group family protein [Streptomyces sp. NPDC012617]|uniref:high mobility group family protein n=1 Tax=Streptomyces TaxID=1883 RepID=UPI0033CCC7A4
MPSLVIRAAEWTHRGLVGAAERLTTGHQVLVAKASERLVRQPAQPAPDAPEPAKTKKESAKEKGKAKAVPGKAAKEAEAPEGKEAAENGKATEEHAKKKEQKTPPVHTTYRPGPRRMIAAAAHWTVDGEGAWDFTIRAGLLAGGLGIVGYFARPLLDSLMSIHPVWIGVLFVILLAAELAPTLVALFLLGLLSAMTTPALMWPASIAWAVAAWSAGAPSKEAATAPEEAPKGEAPPVDPLLLLCAVLIGEAKGVHLNALTAALQDAGSTTIRTPGHVRAALGARGVPTRASVRAPKGAIPGGAEGVTRGVYREDLERVLGPLSDLQPAPPADSVATGVATALTCNVAAPATAVAAP